MSKIAFAAYAPRWVASYTGRTKRGIGQRTLAIYRDDLGLDGDGESTGTGAMAFFGRMPLAQIGPGDMKRYAARLSADGLARSSVRRKLAPVTALLADAHEDGLIRFNPTAGVRIVTPAQEDEEAVERVKALAAAELAAVIDNTPDEWRPFVMFLAETGLRIGEAIEARWSDLDRGNRWLTVARQWHRGAISLPKGRKMRRIRVSARLDALLWEHRKTSRTRDNALMFVGPLGARVDAGNLSERTLKPACVAAGVGEMVTNGKGKLRAESWVSWHTFRHTCASQLFRNGWNAAQVSRFLGHADAGFTLRTYVHLLDDDQPEPNVLESVEHAGVRPALWAVRDTERVDLDEALVGCVPKRLDHGGPILRTLDSPRGGIDGVELEAAVPTDDRLASRHDSIVGAGSTLGQHDVPKPPETISINPGGTATLRPDLPGVPNSAETPGWDYEMGPRTSRAAQVSQERQPLASSSASGPVAQLVRAADS